MRKERRERREREKERKESTKRKKGRGARRKKEKEKGEKEKERKRRERERENYFVSRMSPQMTSEEGLSIFNKISAMHRENRLALSDFFNIGSSLHLRLFFLRFRSTNSQGRDELIT